MLSNKYKLAIFSSLPFKECMKYDVADPFFLDENTKNQIRNKMIYDKKIFLGGGGGISRKCGIINGRDNIDVT
mgnify:CR=1 FL=1